MHDNDLNLLRTIAEHRVLRVGQIAALLQRNATALRRRLRWLADQRLITVDLDASLEKRGRPERVVALTATGVDQLKAAGLLSPDLPLDRVTGPHLRGAAHQLMINDFRVQLAQLSRRVPVLSYQFLCPTSPFLGQSADGHSAVHERFSVTGQPERIVEFIPDGVFSLRHSELDKTLLFFLEADTGTESLTSSRYPHADLRQKIINYRLYFLGGHYKHYEKTWDCQLKGFRVLFLVPSRSRLHAVCRLVRGMPPADFVWATDGPSLAERGLWAPIWVRGGDVDAPPESILINPLPAVS